MKLQRVKEIYMNLLIKKNNFKINNNDLELLSELEFLFSMHNDIQIFQNKKECSCPLQKHNIQQEIELNVCFSCGLPLAVS